MKKKVLIDLDVITVALMKKRDYRKKTAEKFLEMVKQKKFECLTPLPLVERIAAWKDTELKEEIFEFYIRYTEILRTSKIHEKAKSMNIKEEKVLVELEENGIKSKDALLVLVTSLFKIDYLVSFNKKHLKNKEKIINRILKENGLPEIKIINPYEDLDFLESQSKYSFVKLPFILSASFIGSVSLFTLLTNVIFNTEKYKSLFQLTRKRILTPSFKFHNIYNPLKTFSTLLIFFVLLPLALSQTQSHPLREITPIDVNLDMFKFNITNVTFVGINLTNPQYALDVAGDVRWSGTLRGGVVPWNLISEYNLNVNWTGLLGWGNITGYDLNVNWIGKLGWGNLTSYPSIITSIGSGLNASTQSLSGNVILGVNFTEVQRRITGSCSGSNAIQFIYENGSVSCVDINLYGNVTGTGISGYIPLWQTSSSLNNSLINQTNGNIWITSGNLNILLGGLQIGGTSVITSGKHIINIGDVNATRFFQNGAQVIDTLYAGPGISITGSGNSRTISNTGVLSLTAGNGISLNASTGNILINNTGILGINVTAPLTSSGGQTPTLGFNYNTTAFSIVNSALTLADAYFTGAAYDSRFVNEGQANSINTSMIVDGAITNPKIALNAVNYSQIQQVSCPAGQALQVIGGGNYTCVDVNPSGTVSGSGTVGYIPLWNGTYSLNNSIIYQSGGKIGIGTNTPGANLHVIGNVSISDKIAFSDVWIGRATTSRLGIYRTIDGAAGDLSVRNIYFPDTSRSFVGSGNYPFIFNVNGVDIMTIGYNGNVGIGTNSPLNKFEVVGTLNATSGGGIIYLDADGNIRVGI